MGDIRASVRPGRQPGSSLTRAPAPAGRRRAILQRTCDCGTPAGIQGPCARCEGKRSLQRAPEREPVPTVAPPIVHEVLGSPGRPLDPEVRSDMEQRLGHDFSKVRIHTDARAAESARAVHALAYTVGGNVVFGERRYAPSTETGQRLLAHELTHVVQQGAENAQVPSELPIGPTGSPLEHAAERAGRGGGAPEAGSPGPAVVQRETLGQGAGPVQDHYRFELKAWIPHSQVVDPQSAAHILEESSWFHGDGHTGYSGSYRAFTWIEFDWDGAAMSHRVRGEDYGETQRWYVNRFSEADFLPPGLGSVIPGSSSRLGVERGRATCCTEGDSSIYSLYMDTVPHPMLNLGIHSSNPLVTPSPDIDSRLTARFDPNGELKIGYQTDHFPSHGFRVMKNGSAIATEVVFDASGVNASGAAGGLNILDGLTDWTHVGTRMYHWR